MTDIIDVAEALFLPDTPRTRTALYRFYSSAEVLIYLGIKWAVSVALPLLAVGVARAVLRHRLRPEGA